MKDGPICPECKQSFPYGTNLCPEDGSELVEELQPRVERELLPVIRGPAHIDLVYDWGVIIPDGVVCFQIPDGDFRPSLIGRPDPSHSVPIRPSIDLGTHLNDAKSKISRLQAWIERVSGTLALRAGPHGSVATWVRHSGQTEILRVRPNTYIDLHDRDVIIFGERPHAESVKLRIFV